MAKDYDQMARKIIDNFGGADNVTTIMHCMTRLRIVPADVSKVNLEVLKQVEGVIDVARAGDQYQVIIGASVPKVYDAAVRQFHLEGRANGNIEEVQGDNPGEKKNLVTMLIDTISGIFLPIIPGLGGVGILKGILEALVALGLLATDSDTYILFNSLSQGFFYYLPLALSISAAEKFHGNKFITFAVVAGMLYPDIIPEGFGTNQVFQLFGCIPVVAISYTSTVIPAIVASYFIAKLGAVIKKFVPDTVDSILTPLLTIVIAFPVCMIVIGPATYYLGVWMASAYQWVFNLAPAVAGGILGLLWPCTIIFGLHWGFMPIGMQQISTLGGDYFSPITVGCNFAMMGACVGVFLKTRNKELKETAAACSFAAITGGVTEPGLYGILLKYKRPFIICCIFTGVVGVLMSFSSVAYPGIMSVTLITLPALSLLPNGIFVLIGACVAFFGSMICTYLVGFNDSMIIEQ